MAPNTAILEVLVQGIDGLVRADTRRLAGLTEEARGITAPGNERERLEAVRLHRAFERLLVLTRRNLKLFGTVRSVADPYQPERS